MIGAGPLSVKIGVARDPLARMAMLQVGNPTPLKLLLWLGCGRTLAARIETLAHEALASQRSNGEWFNVSGARAADTVYGLWREHRKLT